MTESPYFAIRHVTRSTRNLKNLNNVRKSASLSDNSLGRPTGSAIGTSIVKTENVNSRRRKIKVEYEDVEGDICKGNGSVEAKKEKWEPANWREEYYNIVEMRKHKDAAVDSMGCDRISDQKAEPHVYRYQVLLSLMLSSQTRDQVTSAAMFKLRDHGCNIDNILQTSDQVLGELIYPVGFWKRKVDFIKRTSQILKDQYRSDIPYTVEDLCKLPGVGPKMAHIVTRCAWGNLTGIGVDTHVHRISNRLGWLKKTTKDPEQTRKGLEDWLPREKWSEVNWLLVGFGQQICLPLHPKCEHCLNNTTCNFGKSAPKTKMKEEIKTEEESKSV